MAPLPSRLVEVGLMVERQLMVIDIACSIAMKIFFLFWPQGVDLCSIAVISSQEACPLMCSPVIYTFYLQMKAILYLMLVRTVVRNLS